MTNIEKRMIIAYIGCMQLYQRLWGDPAYSSDLNPIERL